MRPSNRQLKPCENCGGVRALSVEAAADETCSGSRGEGIVISKASGYLANSVTAETSKGSAACPWLLHGQPGQTFALSLIDYGSSSVEDFVKQLTR